MDINPQSTRWAVERERQTDGEVRATTSRCDRHGKTKSYKSVASSRLRTCFIRFQLPSPQQHTSLHLSRTLRVLHHHSTCTHSLYSSPPSAWSPPLRPTTSKLVKSPPWLPSTATPAAAALEPSATSPALATSMLAATPSRVLARPA